MRLGSTWYSVDVVVPSMIGFIDLVFDSVEINCNIVFVDFIVMYLSVVVSLKTCLEKK